MAKTDAQIGIRVTSEFKAKLEAQARKERRSVSNLILKVMEEYLESQKEEQYDRPVLTRRAVFFYLNRVIRRCPAGGRPPRSYPRSPDRDSAPDPRP